MATGTTKPDAPLYDIHCHVLFDIDDGAVDAPMALEMLQLSAQRGVTGMVVTPHSMDVAERGGVDVLDDRLGRVRALVDERGIPMELLPGMEVHLMPDVPERLASGGYIPLNGSRYVLVEFDFIQWANYTDTVLFDIALQGRTPLLAHIERIGPVQEHPAIVEGLVQRGSYTQITAMSLLGELGAGPKQTAEALLKRGLVHVIASDTHRPSGSRRPFLAEIFERLAGLVGDEGAAALLYENPAAVVRNGRLASVEPKPRKRRRWLFLPA